MTGEEFEEENVYQICWGGLFTGDVLHVEGLRHISFAYLELVYEHNFAYRSCCIRQCLVFMGTLCQLLGDETSPSLPKVAVWRGDFSFVADLQCLTHQADTSS